LAPAARGAEETRADPSPQSLAGPHTRGDAKPARQRQRDDADSDPRGEVAVEGRARVIAKAVEELRAHHAARQRTGCGFTLRLNPPWEPRASVVVARAVPRAVLTEAGGSAAARRAAAGSPRAPRAANRVAAGRHPFPRAQP